jgi:hypothetical protein
MINKKPSNKQKAVNGGWRFGEGANKKKLEAQGHRKPARKGTINKLIRCLK